MRDFARAQDKWYPTWPENADDRAFRMQVSLAMMFYKLIDCWPVSESVKMWSMEPVC